ncbi:uncharacterized protein FOMMEDRAFT_153255 [Fomitiporia mediterranea MF3/22]|uniref:uncharacterized protein n=1 Tax=Fomitiporia mediterranea (strain MF3/22) TaxID=694068 RepID=UPI000440792F|nr:uncharacterized protein FOMMEDRAFT_153255 [Fomitiporia mediterranea MF3/22]EJD05910.1 hypothetical protein FOMMEDRAFT_153255 [Fomitiporia mediterranea MF3/22]
MNCVSYLGEEMHDEVPSSSLSRVLDLVLLDAERQTEVDMGKWKGTTNAVRTREIELKKDLPDRRRRKAFCVPQIPVASGFRFSNTTGYLCHETQRQLVRWSLTEHARHPNETNLDAHSDCVGIDYASTIERKARAVTS